MMSVLMLASTLCGELSVSSIAIINQSIDLIVLINKE